jgi:hypothetical protein
VELNSVCYFSRPEDTTVDCVVVWLAMIAPPKGRSCLLKMGIQMKMDIHMQMERERKVQMKRCAYVIVASILSGRTRIQKCTKIKVLFMNELIE